METDGKILWRLDEIDERVKAAVGGKALSLGLMTRAGLPVPDGFCVGVAAYNEAVARPDVTAKLATGGDALRGVALPAAVDAAVCGALAKFSSETLFAVRSSGTLEDLADASFAGQYESYLGVRAEDVPAAIVKCWASASSERVRAYLASQPGTAGKRPEMAVVVQRLVAARAAGVAFTVHPQTGDENRILVEACAGLGDALVSGQVNPDRFVLDRETGRVVERTVAGGKADVVVTDAELARLSVIARRVQAYFGSPQDIEWAVDDAGIHLVQSRAITRISFAPDFGEWTTADFREGGVSARVVTPFLWSLYERVFQGTLPAYMDGLRLVPPDLKGKEAAWSGVFFGRPYWNVGYAKRCLARAPDFNERSFDEDMAIEVAYEGDGVTTPVTLWGVVKAIPTIIAFERGFKTQLARDVAYAGTFAERIAARFAFGDLAKKSDAELFAAYRDLILDVHWETEGNYFMTIYNTSNAKLEFKKSHRALEANDVDASYVDLIGGLDALAPLAPLEEMWEIADGVVAADAALAAEVAAMTGEALAREVEEEKRNHRTTELERSEEKKKAVKKEEGVTGSDAGAGAGARAALYRAIDAYREKFWYHSRAELDITAPRWCEDLAFVCEMLVTCLRHHDRAKSPKALHAKRVLAFERANEAAGKWFSARPWRFLAGRTFRKRLARMRTYAKWREEMRDYSTRVYGYLRLWSLEVARRLVRACKLAAVDDVWHLRCEEVLALVEGKLALTEAAQKIAKSKEYQASYGAFEPPNEIGNRYALKERAAVEVAASGAVLTGIGGSAGIYTGRARVIRHVEAATELARGDILVTRFTDPGWTPLLNQASAVVTEVGGLLSHAAVIAREYGIPAVLAIAGAMERIPDGARVTVDGTRGTVTLHG